MLNRDSAAAIKNPWLLEHSYDIRDGAQKDFMASMKGNWTKLNEGQIDKFKMSFHSKKHDRSESIYVRSRWVTPGHTKNSLEFAVPG